MSFEMNKIAGAILAAMIPVTMATMPATSTEAMILLPSRLCIPSTL